MSTPYCEGFSTQDRQGHEQWISKFRGPIGKHGISPFIRSPSALLDSARTWNGWEPSQGGYYGLNVLPEGLAIVSCWDVISLPGWRYPEFLVLGRFSLGCWDFERCKGSRDIAWCQLFHGWESLLTTVFPERVLVRLRRSAVLCLWQHPSLMIQGVQFLTITWYSTSRWW